MTKVAIVYKYSDADYYCLDTMRWNANLQEYEVSSAQEREYLVFARMLKAIRRTVFLSNHSTIWPSPFDGPYSITQQDLVRQGFIFIEGELDD